jgi:hypothetical protein
MGLKKRILKTKKSRLPGAFPFLPRLDQSAAWHPATFPYCGSRICACRCIVEETAPRTFTLPCQNAIEIAGIAVK